MSIIERGAEQACRFGGFQVYIFKIHVLQRHDKGAAKRRRPGGGYIAKPANRVGRVRRTSHDDRLIHVEFHRVEFLVAQSRLVVISAKIDIRCEPHFYKVILVRFDNFIYRLMGTFASIRSIPLFKALLILSGSVAASSLRQMDVDVAVIVNLLDAIERRAFGGPCKHGKKGYRERKGFF